GLGKRLILIQAVINLDFVVVVVRHRGINGSQGQIVSTSNLFQAASHPSMHQDDVRDSDSSPCDQRLASASAWRAFNVLKYSHPERQFIAAGRRRQPTVRGSTVRGYS